MLRGRPNGPNEATVTRAVCVGYPNSTSAIAVVIFNPDILAMPAMMRALPRILSFETSTRGRGRRGIPKVQAYDAVPSSVQVGKAETPSTACLLSKGRPGHAFD